MYLNFNIAHFQIISWCCMFVAVTTIQTDCFMKVRSLPLLLLTTIATLLLILLSAGLSVKCLHLQVLTITTFVIVNICNCRQDAYFARNFLPVKDKNVELFEAVIS